MNTNAVTSTRLQNTAVHFRVNAVVASALAARAQQAGVTVSEYCRTVIRERVGLS